MDDIFRAAFPSASCALLEPKVVAGRVLLATVSLMSGASIGREGPTVHVGAAIARACGRWLPHSAQLGQRRALVLAGGTLLPAPLPDSCAGTLSALMGTRRNDRRRNH